MEQRSEDLAEEGRGYEEIGRIVSEEVAKLFEAIIKARTIAQRARRSPDINPVTNVTQNSQPPETITNFQSNPPEIIKDRHPQGGGAREGAGRPVSDGTIEEFLIKAKKLAKLAYKARSAPSFEMRKKELTAATHLITIVITETREDLKWV